MSRKKKTDSEVNEGDKITAFEEPEPVVMPIEESIDLHTFVRLRSSTWWTPISMLLSRRGFAKCV
jgi:hypothetical protein